MYILTTLEFPTRNINYGFIMAVNSMEFNGVRPARNIQFGLASDLRFGRHELNLRPDSCKQPGRLSYRRPVNNLQGKQSIRTKVPLCRVICMRSNLTARNTDHTYVHINGRFLSFNMSVNPQMHLTRP